MSFIHMMRWKHFWRNNRISLGAHAVVTWIRLCDLTVHLRKHTRDILGCSHLYETTCKGSISVHMRKHTMDMLKCPYWEYEITQTDRLNSHLSQHVKNMFKWILLRPRLLKSHLYVGRNQKFTKKVDDKKKFLQELKKIFFLLESLWIF